MKFTQRITLSLCLLFFGFPLFSQHNHSPGEQCGFDRKMQKLIDADPELKSRLEDYQQRILPAVSRAARKANSRSMMAPIIRVPVVVHIIHNAGENPGEGQNLSDAQIEAQIEVLNEDFSATNPNFNDTPSRWTGAVGDPEIQFCLASIDPTGSASTGITRDVMTVTVDMDGEDNIESDIKPALNWDPNLYYNIYVLPIPGTTAGGGTTGYAYLPSGGAVGNPSLDGSVVDYRWFGGPGFSQSGYKTLTHETGHYLGLYHPFQGEDCGADDGLDDTPNVDRPTSDFPFFSCNSSFPTGPSSCTDGGGADIEHMYINYMDYSSGSCKTSFTNDQIAVMRAVLNGDMTAAGWASRLPLANNTLAVCTFNTNDASLAEIVEPGGFLCDTSMITPQVKITNFGISPLTTLTINYQVDANPVVSFIWIDNLASGASEVVSLPAFAPPVGTFNFTAYTTFPNGQNDENITNDTMMVSSTGVVRFDLPLQESFNGPQFDPSAAGIFNFNPDQDAFVWKHNTSFSSFGDTGACSEFDNYSTVGGEDPNNTLDAMITQIYDFSDVTNATLSFDVAYAPYDDTFNDSLIILASIDCGNTFSQSLYRKGHTGLATAPATTGLFTPTAGQWRTETIDLSAYNNLESFSVAFINLSGYGNKMYIDNINVLPECFISTTEIEVDALCNGECNGSATVTPDGGTMGYDFLWDTNASSQTTATASNLCAGDYEVTLTDVSSCTKVVSVTVGEPDALTLVVNSTAITGAGANDGTATAVPSGGDATCYTYEWSNTENTAMINNLPPDTYTVTVTDCSDCTEVQSVVIDPFDCTIVCTFVSVDANCEGESSGEISLSPSGGNGAYTYTWDIPGVTGQNPTGLMAGTYIVSVSDEDDCETVLTIIVSEPPALTATTSSTAVSQVGAMDGTASASAGGGSPNYTYDWGAFGTGTMISGLSPGGYTVTITDANDCMIERQVTVADVDCSSFEIENTSSTDVFCSGEANGTASVLSAIGGTAPYTYLWSDPAAQTDSTAVGLIANTYTVTVTDAQLCTQTAMVTVGSPDVLSFTFSEVVAVNCNGESNGSLLVAVAGGVAPFNYNWADIPVDSGERTNLSAGNYCLTVTDANGCSFEDCLLIAEPDPLEISFSGTMELDCFGDLSDMISFDVSGGNAMSGYSYNWDPVQTPMGAFLDDLSAGVYSLTVTDGLGCSVINEFEITQPTELTVNLSATAETTGGANDGTATAVASGGNPGYNYNWGAAGMGSMITGLTPGLYVVTVTDDNGCETIQSVVVPSGSVDCSNFTVALSATEVICNGESDGTATATPSGGQDPYAIEWSSSDIGPTATGLPAGIVTVTITDANDCILIEEIEIIEPDPIDVTFVVTNESAPGAMDGAITAAATGGVGGYDYTWLLMGSPTLTGPTISNLSAGNYTLIVTDANDCVWEQVIPLEVNSVDCANFEAVIEKTDITCPGGTDGTATAIPSDGMTPYTYQWSAGTGTGATRFNLPSGIVMVTVTDANNCTFIAEREIREPLPIIIASFVTSESGAGSNDGAIIINITGGTDPFTYDWGDLVGTNDPKDRNGLAGGIYNLTVTDANGCTEEKEIIVPIGNIDCANLTGVIEVEDVSCFGLMDGSATVFPSGGTMPYSFLWSTGETTATINDLPFGLVIVEITDANNCSYVAEAFIGQPDLLQVSTNVMHESSAGANDGSITAIAMGGNMPYNFDWGSAGTGPTINNLVPGIYGLTVTDAKGCSLTTAAEVLAGQMTNCDDLESSISTLPVSCPGAADGIATIVVGGGQDPYTILWGNGDSGNTAFALPGGVIGVTITDANNCVIEDEAIVGEPDPIVITITHTNETSLGLNDGTASASVSGGTAPYTYNWGSAGTGPDLINLAPGVYVVEVTDAKGCSAFESVTILEGPVGCMLVSVITEIDVSCNGLEDGSANVSASGGTEPYTYLWSNGDTGPTAINLPGGLVFVTITDADNCVLVDQVLIEEPDPLIVNASATDETLQGAGDGTASALAMGGTPPYIYDWGSAGMGQTITGLVPDVYVVLVTDARGCIIETEVEVKEGPPDCSSIVLTFETIEVSCNGLADGSAEVIVEGGMAPFQYQWSGNLSTTASITGPAGTYQVTVFDAQGCEVEGLVEITEPAVLSLDVVGFDGECGSNASAVASASGGQSPFTYAWSNGGDTKTITDLLPGTFSVTVTDANGCTVSGSTNVTVNNSGIAIAVDRQNISCFGETDGSIDITITQGTPPYDIQWSNGSTGTSLSDLSADTYSVQITDAVGCVFVRTIVVESPAPVAVSVNTQSADPTDEDGTATANASGGIPPYTYLWSTGETSLVIRDLASGVYTVTVTDLNGCSAIGEFAIYTTSIIDIPTLQTFELSPNPSTGLFYLDIAFAERMDYQITVYNLLGQQLYFSEEKEQSLQLAIDLSAFPTGTYYVQLKTESGQVVKPLVLIP